MRIRYFTRIYLFTIAVLYLAAALFWGAPAMAAGEKPTDNKKTLPFLVTAYYKPLPGQGKYIMGSFEKEKRMNGEGIATTSGTAPHGGTVAADPKLLPFGTKVSIPGYGDGVVEDTGGAIKGNHIDVFMGEGESALQKALDWGEKKVAVEIVPLQDTQG